MPSLSFACFETDRTRPILDGRVVIPGVTLERDPDEEDMFRRALRERAFAVTELSMSSHILTTGRGDAPYIAIPVFLSRSFRHGSIYVRSDRGIETPADLAGRTIGLPEFQQTAALWVRGILRDHYGVDLSAVRWRTGGLDRPGRGERVPLSLPAAMDVAPIGPGETLSGLLAAGALDAVIAPSPPQCFVTGQAAVRRLFPAYRREEEAYFRATGFFPIMHCLAIRKDVAEAHPSLPAALFRAFAEAKALSLREILRPNVLRVALPWIVPEAEAQIAQFGGNPWPYGLAANRREVETMLAYAQQDGILTVPLEPEALFHPATIELYDEPV